MTKCYCLFHDVALFCDIDSRQRFCKVAISLMKMKTRVENFQSRFREVFTLHQ